MAFRQVDRLAVQAVARRPPVRRPQRVRRQRCRAARRVDRRPAPSSQRRGSGSPAAPSRPAWPARRRPGPRSSGSWPTAARPNRPCRRRAWRRRPASSARRRRTRRRSPGAAADPRWASGSTGCCANWRIRCRRCGRSPSWRSAPTALAATAATGCSPVIGGIPVGHGDVHMAAADALLVGDHAEPFGDLVGSAGVSVIGNSCGTVGGRPTASNRAPSASAASAATLRSRVQLGPQFVAACQRRRSSVSTWQVVNSNCRSTPRSAACRATDVHCGRPVAPVSGSTRRNSSSTPTVGWLAMIARNMDPARRRSHDGPDRAVAPLAVVLRWPRSLAAENCPIASVAKHCISDGLSRVPSIGGWPRTSGSVSVCA